jgi:hypothetical protein
MKANKIDSLKTGKDVESFISSLVKQKYDCRYCIFHLAKPDSVNSYFSCDSTIELESDTWQKTDFNKDGLTDLFAIIYEHDTVNSHFPQYKVYVVIDQKNNKYQLNEIPDYFMINCYSVKQIFIDNEPCLIYRHFRTDYTVDTLPGVDTFQIPLDSAGRTMTMPKTQVNYFQVGKTDTLVYKIGGFVELKRKNQKSPEIESIYFETTPCFGDCPIFDLKIFKDGHATYVRHEGLTEPYGNFKCVINLTQLKEIIDLIKYLNILDLENYYGVNATDMQTVKLSINFSDGKTKNIEDYGLQGTMGLVRLYNLLFELRLNQKWK